MFDAIQNELQYRFGTQGANEGTKRKGTDGQYDIGIVGRALGVTPEMMTNAGNAHDRRAFEGTALGEKAASYGLSPKTGAVNTFEIGKGVREAESLEQGTKLAIAAGVDPSKLEGLDLGGVASLTRTQKETNTNNSYLNNPANIRENDRYLDLQKTRSDDRRFDRSERALDRKQTQDLAILSGDHQMQIAQMNSELSDKRMAYDRETRSMDKRDRMIAQLMSGIGTLGGAFAL